jgi:hypothetical protein
MEVQEILAQLERNEGEFPHLAIQEAMARPQEIIPHLLAVLEEVERDPQPFLSDQNRLIHIIAMYLLAYFQEPRAYPLLLRIFAAPGETPFDLVGDVITEDLGRILASVSGGDLAGLVSLVENEDANEYVRSAAIDGLLRLVSCGWRTRAEVMACLAGFFRSLQRTPSAVWDGLAHASVVLCPAEVIEDLRQADSEGLIDHRAVLREEIEEAFDMGVEEAWKELRQRYTLITDVEEELKWWDWFHPHDPPSEMDDPFFDSLPLDFDIPTPYRRSEPKVGRNEPCPCGSGKKFKKCCGR